MTITIEHAAPPLRTPCLTVAFSATKPPSESEIRTTVQVVKRATGRVFIYQNNVYFEQTPEDENGANGW